MIVAKQMARNMSRYAEEDVLNVVHLAIPTYLVLEIYSEDDESLELNEDNRFVSAYAKVVKQLQSPSERAIWNLEGPRLGRVGCWTSELTGR